MKTPSILDGIRVASPCRASWDAMAGDDRARFCSECRKNVYNLSAMTTAEAVAFVVDREGDACVRFYQRSDGTTLTADCPVGAGKARSGRFRRLASLGVVGLAMGSTALAAVGLGRGPNAPMPSSPRVSLDDWIDWAMIKVGLRKLTYVVLGKLMPIQLPATPVGPSNPNPNCPQDPAQGGEMISADQY